MSLSIKKLNLQGSDFRIQTSDNVFLHAVAKEQANAFLHIVNAYIEKGDLKSAQEVAEEIKRCSIKLKNRAFMNIAEAYLKKDDILQNKNKIEKIKDCSPDKDCVLLDRAFLNIAKAFLEKGDTPNATKALKKIKDISALSNEKVLFLQKMRNGHYNLMD